MPLNYHGNEFQFAVIENLRNKMEKELDKLMEYYKLKD
uniref:Uncharacterized protein n=1 Tax=uncultured bacterium contig00063 TaxID=1181546 RepID=A0A806KH41_9BACT|nr:hypothetical protein [uncultured bacterium contig00063]